MIYKEYLQKNPPPDENHRQTGKKSTVYQTLPRLYQLKYFLRNTPTAIAMGRRAKKVNVIAPICRRSVCSLYCFPKDQIQPTTARVPEQYQ